MNRAQAFVRPLLPSGLAFGEGVPIGKADRERELAAAILSLGAVMALSQWAADVRVALSGPTLAAAVVSRAHSMAGSGRRALVARERAKLAHAPAERAAADGRVMIVDAGSDAALWHTLQTLLGGARGVASPARAAGGGGGAVAEPRAMAIFMGPRLVELLDAPRPAAGERADARAAALGAASVRLVAGASPARPARESDGLDDDRTMADELRAAILSVVRRTLTDATPPPSATDGAAFDVARAGGGGGLVTGGGGGLVTGGGGGAPAGAAPSVVAQPALHLDLELAPADSTAASAAAADGLLRAAHTRAARLLWQRHSADAALRVDMAAHLALAPAETVELEPAAGAAVGDAVCTGGEDERLVTWFGLVALFGAAQPALPLLLLAHALLGARAHALRALIFERRALPSASASAVGAGARVQPARALGVLAALSPVSTVALVLLCSPLPDCLLAPAHERLAQFLPPPVRRHAAPRPDFRAPAHRRAPLVPRRAALQANGAPWAVPGQCAPLSTTSLLVLLMVAEHALLFAKWACPCCRPLCAGGREDGDGDDAPD